jgi:hypothetical protein
MNVHGVKAIYRFEMARWGRTLWQSLVAPVITTSLYFLVFGAAIGGRMSDMAGVEYGSFIVPRPDPAVSPDPGADECQFWHFLSEVYGYYLRNTLSTTVAA